MSAASRLNEVVQALAIVESKEPTWRVWRDVLHFGGLPDDEAQDRVAESLAELRAQLRSVERELTERGVPKHLYEIAMTRLRGLLALDSQHNQWSGIKAGHLQGRVLMAWQWVRLHVTAFGAPACQGGPRSTHRTAQRA